MQIYKLASAQAKGRSHIKSELPCQDVTFCHKSGDFYFAALADGAGSCKHSLLGAEFITQKVCQLLNKKFARFIRVKDGVCEIEILKFIEDELKFLSQKEGVDFKELSSTLLFMAIKDERCIVGHIGDGVIGTLHKDESLRVLSLPQNGDFANQTYFTTSVTHKNRLRIYKLSRKDLQDILGFVLLSDGSCESLYDKKENKLSKVNSKMINWLLQASETEVSQALENNLKELFVTKTTDDCSIAIIRVIPKQNLL